MDLRGLQLQAIREIGVDQKDTVRVTLARSPRNQIKEGHAIAALHMRFNLAEMFEPDEFDE